jgi:hypothetical protein
MLPLLEGGAIIETIEQRARSRVGLKAQERPSALLVFWF